MTGIESFVDKELVDLSVKFEKTDKTYGTVLQLLYENDPNLVEKLKESKIVEIETDDIGKGKGYASYVYRVRLRFDFGDAYSFVLKVPTIDSWEEMNTDLTKEEREHNDAMICQAQNTECASYKMLSKIPNFPAPTLWYAKQADQEQPGMLIMSDLSQEGKAVGIFYSVTKEQCFNVVKHLVDFQTYVECLPESEWRNKFKINMHARSSVEKIWKRMIKPIEDYEADKGLQTKVQNILGIDFFALGKYTTETAAEEMGCSTLCHGDLWTNNMLIKLNRDGSVSNEVLGIIDWQTTFEGNGLFDIARFVTNCADADLRRQIETNLIDFYYDQLTEKLREHGKVPRFTREQAHKLYEFALIQETGLLCVMFAVIALPLKDSDADQEDVKKLALRLNSLFDDAIPLLRKYGMHEKFKLKE